MFERVEAIYEHCIFRPLTPLDPVNLRDQQRVHLSIELANGQTPQAWLHQVQAMQAAIVERHGVLPDSASEIAADRLR